MPDWRAEEAARERRAVAGFGVLLVVVMMLVAWSAANL